MFPSSAWIPNGAQPAGIFGSVNAIWRPWLNVGSKTSTRPLWKSVAYSLWFRMARPS